MLELKAFQIESADLIAKRYTFFAHHPDRPKKGNKPRPYFQALSAITGAGKTPILAQAVACMRLAMEIEPIVFWMSKAKSVVAQTYSNFSPGGKYFDILEGFQVITVPELTPWGITDGSTPMIVMATTGLFNNKEQSEGALNIYKRDQDLFGDQSPWERLIERQANGTRRPLLIVYDEGHNLSEQQTEILSELEAEAYLLASATLKLPLKFQKSVIQPIQTWFEETEAIKEFTNLKATDDQGNPEAERFVTTVVNSQQVVLSELVKKAIQFDGTTAPMEYCIDDLIKRMKVLTKEIQARSLGFKPKAIYVCRTNITDEGDRDDVHKPFGQRQAPPIKIWRYLVEEKGIDPATIAIYADLKFASGNKPDAVNLFSKGENDFDAFCAGNYQHIIFNLGLQEGWDDPACYLAYIDKSIGSSIQVEQIIGRVLRQYGATHYDTPLLNSAHFFLRVDKHTVFTEAIDHVKQKLVADGVPIEITDYFTGGKDASGAMDVEPRSVKAPLHHVFVDSTDAEKEIARIVKLFPTFSEGTPDTVAEAHKATHVVDLTNPDSPESVKWRADSHTNTVRLRWLITTAIRSRSGRALSVVNLKDPKFDVRVQIQSLADRQSEMLAQQIVSAYFQFSYLAYESSEPFVFGTIRVPKNAPTFTHSLYPRYGGLNKLELPIAQALDKDGCVWHRNASAGGFHIPLLSEGNSGAFYPDFIAWKKGKIYCIDAKGSHLLSDAVTRKLFDIQEDGTNKILVRFITEGKQAKLLEKPAPDGYTVWKMKSGSPTPIHVQTLQQAIVESLR